MNRTRTGKRKYRRRRKNLQTRFRISLLPVLALAVIICFALGLALNRTQESDGAPKDVKDTGSGAVTSAAEQTGDAREPAASVKVGAVELAGIPAAQWEDMLNKAYEWNMRVTDGSESVPLENLLNPQIEEIIKQIGSKPSGQSQDYEIDVRKMQASFEAQAAELAERWNKRPVNSQMESFDKTTGTYQYTKAAEGRTLNQEQLVSALMEAAEKGGFKSEIQASFDMVPPERTQAQAKEQYRVIGTFTTKTTSNKNRNQNIHLAAQAIDGVVLKPGEEFSFNSATGNRTSEKGYQPAGAYRNGVLIEEPGGGVCQVSTTLYHAIIESGFKTTERNFHSFAPSYIKEGQDAMVSFDGYAGPDLRFVNTQSTSVGLRASFQNNQLKLSIVGLPVLEDGTSVSMRSEKVKDIEPPEPIYEENPELAFGQEKVIEQAKPGSVWKSYRITSKGGQIVEETPLYTSTYKAKPARIQINSTAVLPQEGAGQEVTGQTNTGQEVMEQANTEQENAEQERAARQEAGQEESVTQDSGEGSVPQETVQEIITPFEAGPEP